MIRDILLFIVLPVSVLALIAKGVGCLDSGERGREKIVNGDTSPFHPGYFALPERYPTTPSLVRGTYPEERVDTRNVTMVTNMIQVTNKGYILTDCKCLGMKLRAGTKFRIGMLDHQCAKGSEERERSRGCEVYGK